MPLINLIESQILSAKRAERQLQLSKFVFLGVVTVIGSSYFVMLAEGASLGNQASTIEGKLKKLKPLQEKIDACKKEQSNLEPRLKTLEDARKLTNRWSNLMEHLSHNTPTNVWLTAFRSNAIDPEKPIHITFNGVGQTQTLVSEMMLRTQNATDLEGVTLVGSQEKMFEKSTGIEFEMSGDIIDTAAIGCSPDAVSADSITASVPSKMAFATSEASARVGSGFWIIDSSI